MPTACWHYQPDKAERKSAAIASSASPACGHWEVQESMEGALIVMGSGLARQQPAWHQTGLCTPGCGQLITLDLKAGK